MISITTVYLLLVLVGGLMLSTGCGQQKDPALRTPPPGMIYIAAGSFLMGTDPEAEENTPPPDGLNKPPYENEAPQRKVYLEAFYIDTYEVTYREYQNFIYETGYDKPPHWEDTDLFALADYPVRSVNWKGAAAYAQWVGKRLPSEAEWEKAARGVDGRRFLWGNDPQLIKTMAGRNKYHPVTEIPSYDTSVYGVIGMMSNVAEWTADWYRPYPGNQDVDKDYGAKYRVIRGETYDLSGHYNAPYFYRLAYRSLGAFKEAYQDVGFRCVWSVGKNL